MCQRIGVRHPLTVIESDSVGYITLESSLNEMLLRA